MTIRRLIISDLHFGSGDDLLGSPAALERIEPELAWADELVDQRRPVRARVRLAQGGRRRGAAVPRPRQPPRRPRPLRPGQPRPSSRLARRRRAPLLRRAGDGRADRVSRGAGRATAAGAVPRCGRDRLLSRVRARRHADHARPLHRAAHHLLRLADDGPPRLVSDRRRRADRAAHGRRVRGPHRAAVRAHVRDGEPAVRPARAAALRALAQRRRLDRARPAAGHAPNRQAPNATAPARVACSTNTTRRARRSSTRSPRSAATSTCQPGTVVVGHTHVPLDGVATPDGRHAVFNSGSWVWDRRVRNGPLYRSQGWPGTVLRATGGDVELRGLLTDCDERDLAEMVGVPVRAPRRATAPARAGARQAVGPAPSRRRAYPPIENIVSRSCRENASKATIVWVRATPCIDEIWLVTTLARSSCCLTWTMQTKSHSPVTE